MTFQTVNLARVVAPAFYPVHRDIKAGRHTHYWLKGGRGSTKSSFASIEIILGIMQHPGTHAVCYRKVKDTLKDSVFAQLLWAIDTLGVTHLWRATESPMRLIYMPTQQQILFRGLDKAKKSKSIKPKSGYFRYIWFEELDEFTGMEEIRTVMQSVMRGGERFCCFCTYNPPKSQRNWVNTEVAENAPDRLIHHSDYRNVPPDWLGEQFVIEAEHLRDTRPDLYAHEYLGEVTGTGTEVFQNLTFREITDEEIKRFAEFNRGLDFGYSGDPLHYTVNHYDGTRRKLYIFHELHALRMSNMVLAENILSEMSLHGGGRVCCDSEDPKSIDDLYYLGVAAYGAYKGAGSVKWGIKFLSEEVEEIIIDPVRCPNTKREFYNYALDIDPHGNVIPEYPDKDNHSIDAVRYSLERRIRARFAKGVKG